MVAPPGRRKIRAPLRVAIGRQAPTPLPDSPGSQLGQRGLGLGRALVIDVGSPHEAPPALRASPRRGRRCTAPVSQLARILDVLQDTQNVIWLWATFSTPSMTEEVAAIHGCQRLQHSFSAVKRAWKAHLGSSRTHPAPCTHSL